MMHQYLTLIVSKSCENQLYVYNIDVTDEDDPSANLQLITTDIPDFALGTTILGFCANIC